ncbi:hypothetical protein [Candidatus Nitrosocosmicus sp. T]
MYNSNKFSKMTYCFLGIVLLLFSFSLTNYVLAQTTWETFKEKDGLYSLQIPSNWIPQKAPEQDKVTPIDDLFYYYPVNQDSFVWVDVMIGESLYYDVKDSLDASIALYKSYDNYKLIQPVECENLTLNNLSACSMVQSLQMESEMPRKELSVVMIDPNGIEYTALFVASEDLYDKFLPVAKYMISTLTFDTDKVASTLGIEPSSSSTSNQQQLSPSSNNSSSNAMIIPDWDLPPVDNSFLNANLSNSTETDMNNISSISSTPAPIPGYKNVSDTENSTFFN